MKRGIVILLLLAAAAVFAYVRVPNRRPPGTAVDLTTGTVEAWAVYDGVLQARRVEPVMSQFAGGATIIELAEEGRAVRKGDRLVRFDATQVEQDLRKADYEVTLAESEQDGLRNATLPMERQDLETQLAEARVAVESEAQFLEETRALLGDQLVSPGEVRQQELKVESLRAKLRQMDAAFTMTTGSLHRARLAKVDADLDAARRRREFVQMQWSNAVVVAPCDGMVVYAPMQLGGDFRTVRLGDTVFRNQPFMLIPDMSELIAECHIPEAELGRVRTGARADLVPVAWPELRAEGVVESVSAMAQSRPGFPAWQKYFRVILRLTQRDERLRTGISLVARIESARRTGVLRIPRAAVEWSGDRPSCVVRTAAGDQARALSLGVADDMFHEVLEGARAGEKVVLP